MSFSYFEHAYEAYSDEDMVPKTIQGYEIGDCARNVPNKRYM